METDFSTHAAKYAHVYEGDIDLNPKHPIFPPDYLEDEKHIFLNPQSTYIKVSASDFTHVDVDVSTGNAPLQVNFLFDDGKMEKDFVWIGEQKRIPIPFPADGGPCNVYFLRKLNKGFCKATFKMVKA
jgi:hypothetical protein